MKKLLALTLTVCFLLSCACAEEVPAAVQPFIGGWYAWMEVSEAPNRSALGDYTHILAIITFELNGDVTIAELDYVNGAVELSAGAVAGSWSVGTDGRVMTKIIAVGEAEAYIRDGVLYASIYDPTIVYAFHPCQHFDWYSDVKRVMQ